jgi:hypothetical protein
MRYAVIGVAIGAIGAVIGYNLFGSLGVLIGAALGPITTLFAIIVFAPEGVADFIVKALGVRRSG